MKKILVVCMGNICRSPTGEAILRAKAKQRSLDLMIDSAGTIDYHQGNEPDPRARAAGERRGYSFAGIRSRKVQIDDFENFDIILAADEANVADLRSLCPTQYQHKIKLFLSYLPAGGEVPDPYYGGDQGFETVLDLIEQASDLLLDSMVTQ